MCAAVPIRCRLGAVGVLLESVVAIPRGPSVPGVCSADPLSKAVRTEMAATTDGLTDPMNIGPSNGLGVLGDWGYR
jgi:hypothetical protein